MVDLEIIAAILTSGMVPTQPDIAARPDYSLRDEDVQQAFHKAAEDAVSLYRAVLDVLRENPKP
jgi:hypothetical protein